MGNGGDLNICIKERGDKLPEPDVMIVEARNKKPSLKVVSEGGSIKTLHSLYDPEAEAKNIVNAFEFDGTGILVVLGLGLGYHLRELGRRYPDARIIVVEAIPEIYELTEGHVEAFDSNMKFMVGLSHDEVIKRITVHIIRGGMLPLSVFALPSAVSSFPGYYSPILNVLENTIADKVAQSIKKTITLLEITVDRLVTENISSEMSANIGELCFDLGLYAKAKYFLERSLAVNNNNNINPVNDLYESQELDDMKVYWDACARHNAMGHIATDNWESEDVFHKCGERDLADLLKNLDEEFLKNGNKKVLEIGCGIGRILKPFANMYPDLNIFGVDVSEEMVRKGRLRLEEIKNVKLIRTSGKDLKLFENNSFDFVYSFVVLQHIPRKFVRNYFKEVSRILDERGFFVFQMPISTEENKPPEPPDSDFRTVRFYSLEEVNMICRSNGLNIAKTSRFSEDSLWFTTSKTH
jgi:cyclopropane fatty-acyl-phospholipid synthase-like methyltransferase